MLVGHILEDDEVFFRSEAPLPQERVLLTLERALLHRMLQEGSDALEPLGSQQHVGVFCLPCKQSVSTVVVSNAEHVQPCCKSKGDGLEASVLNMFATHWRSHLPFSVRTLFFHQRRKHVFGT